eukprot:CAMPEP_0181239210 /NCGR_PEP_ID=MMETSP1096-20121128/39802_1 /TAXON_ID=156174 ORGANISM="Chrysochromulina ericina, Strain CCMP281" /NCGR_SAMPLE_ID=MMETSP1096 /ASSEMBLY_ACC=CAM_ASM_000453 /LENGTH=65 /DNA_ID=CAMNT_0023334871 /DNA_START=96 /DNA_END=293 /DNA_ORIENTATION=-
MSKTSVNALAEAEPDTAEIARTHGTSSTSPSLRSIADMTANSSWQPITQSAEAMVQGIGSRRALV